ncbi:MAG TPA: phosphotriesterase [Baekduia sp.]|nr:phosphotriesterase [Baekduia sp.]
MIETALGAIAPAALGVTSMHDHLLSDATLLHRAAAGALERVTAQSAATIGTAALATVDNLRLDDEALAVRELAAAGSEGLSTVVDLTSWSTGHLPRLPAISRATGVQIVAGVGVYLDRPHPAWVGELDDAELTERFRAALQDAIPGTSYRAGILGVIGTGAPATASEGRVLDAVARAVALTGAPATVRLDPAARSDGAALLARLADGGCPPDRVILPNADELLELDDAGRPIVAGLAALARAGATLELCFGNVFRMRAGFPHRSDEQRLDALVALVDQGLADRIVLGQSTWMKIQLAAYGGAGYGHLLRRVVPALRARGVAEAELDRMLTGNPRRLLQRPHDHDLPPRPASSR